MKKLLLLAVLMFVYSLAAAAAIKVATSKGGVYVRHNVQEEWVRVAPGDELKPDDSMKLEKSSAATLVIDGKKKIPLPELVAIDLSDLRTLTQGELLLKLAMEQVRTVPAVEHPQEMELPRTTT